MLPSACRSDSIRPRKSKTVLCRKKEYQEKISLVISHMAEKRNERNAAPRREGVLWDINTPFLLSASIMKKKKKIGGKEDSQVCSV